MAKEVTKQLVSPVGEARWPKVNTQVDSFEGVEKGYTIRLQLSKEETKKLQAQIVEEFNRQKITDKFKGKRWGLEPFYPWSENKEGQIEFKFKTQHFFERKDGTREKKIVPIYDAKGKPYDPELSLGNGSKIRIAYAPIAFNTSTRICGITLYLNAIQVLELVEYNKPVGAKSFGFEVDESEEASDNDIPF